MTTTGPNSPGTLADDNSIGGMLTSWQSPSNAGASDNSYSTSTGVSGGSHYLKGTNFGFSIPTGDVIDGITVEVERYGDPGLMSGKVKDNAIRIVKADGTIGTTDKSSGSDWAGTDPGTYVTYGGAADLWGETWTPANINDVDFGCAISCQQGSSGSGGNGKVDHVRITITHHSPTLNITSTVSAVVATTGAITNTRELTATVAGVVATTADATWKHPVDAAVAGVTNFAASFLSNIVRIDSTIAGVVNVAAATLHRAFFVTIENHLTFNDTPLLVTRELTAVAGGALNLADATLLNTYLRVTSTIGGNTQFAEAAALNTRELTTTVAGVSNWAALLSTKRRCDATITAGITTSTPYLSNIVRVTAGPAAAVTAFSSVAWVNYLRPRSTINGQSDFAAALLGTHTEQDAEINAATTFAASAILVTRELTALVPAVSHTVGALSVTRRLTATVAAVIAPSAMPSVKRPVTATVAAVTSVAAGVLSNVRRITATIVGSSNAASAAADLTRRLTSTVAGAVNVAAIHKVTRRLTATMAGVLSPVAAITNKRRLTATLAPVSSFTAGLSSDRRIESTVAAVSLFTATPTVTRAVNATVAAGLSPVAAVTVRRKLTGTVAGASNLAAATIHNALSARIAGALNFSGGVSVTKRCSATIAGATYFRADGLRNRIIATIAGSSNLAAAALTNHRKLTAAVVGSVSSTGGLLVTRRLAVVLDGRLVFSHNRPDAPDGEAWELPKRYAEISLNEHS